MRGIPRQGYVFCVIIWFDITPGGLQGKPHGDYCSHVIPLQIDSDTLFKVVLWIGIGLDGFRLRTTNDGLVEAVLPAGLQTGFGVVMGPVPLLLIMRRFGALGVRRKNKIAVISSKGPL